MIQCVAFDIDGVLVDTKPLHQMAILHSLNKHNFPVTIEYHKAHLDGLPTKEKLNKLNIPLELRQSIFDLKQKITFERVNDFIKPKQEISKIFENLRKNGLKIAICSNAIRRFCELTIECLGIKPDILLSNEDAKAKPDPDMYLQVQSYFNCSPGNLLVCEDSRYGLEAAYKSGSCVCYIADSHYLTWKKLEPYLGL
jgi:beta-phosphoglucomutase